MRDYTRGLEEPGLYLLLAKADKLDPKGILDRALPVRRADLMSRPDAFRGRLLKTPMQYAEVQRLQPADRMLWPRAVWGVTGLGPDHRPLTVLLVQEPIALARFTRVWAVGYFFKLRTDRRRQPDPNTGDTSLTLPVLVGKTLPLVQAHSPSPTTSYLATLLALAAMLAAYLLLRRIGRDQRTTARRRYRPLRYEPDLQPPPDQPDLLTGKDPAEALETLADMTDRQEHPQHQEPSDA